MLKGNHRTVASIAAGAFLLIGTPAMALSSSAEAAFEAEISEAKTKMMAHSSTALEHARKARKLASGESRKAKKAQLTAQWLEAEALMRMNNAEAAAPIIDAAMGEAKLAFAGSKLHADLLRSQANLNARQGAFAEALPFFKKASALYEKLGDARSQAIVLQNIGSLYSKARMFDMALGFYQKAGEAFPADPGLALSAHNNTGNALKGLGRYEEAEEAFAKALEAAKAKKSPLLEARILTNIASAQALAGKTDEAEKTAASAMSLANEHAPNWARFVHGVIAQIELDREELDKAEEHLSKAFEGQDLTKTAAHFREFHEVAKSVFLKRNEAYTAKLHQDALARLDKGVAKLAMR